MLSPGRLGRAMLLNLYLAASSSTAVSWSEGLERDLSFAARMQKSYCHARVPTKLQGVAHLWPWLNAVVQGSVI